jgi:hypothetical protein
MSRIPSNDLRVGDHVIRSHRLLRTTGTVIRIAAGRARGDQQVWVRWHHPHTLPNPSLEHSGSLEEVSAPSPWPPR